MDRSLDLAMPSRWPAIFAGALVFAVALLLADRFHEIEQDRQRQVERSMVVQESAAMRARIERELNATLYLMNGLAAYVSAHEDLLEPDRVEGVLRALHRNSEHVRNVGLAPDNELVYVYPLEGNEAAIGLRYEERPDQWPAVERAIRERRIVMTGPIELAQGGRGLVVRTPVFLEDGRYWGMLTLVIDSASLFRAAGLIDRPPNGTRFALRWSPSSDADASVIHGDPELFADPGFVQQIAVPGGYWQLAAKLPEAPSSPRVTGLQMLQWGGIVIAALAGLLAVLLVDRRIRAAWQAQRDPLTRLPNRRCFGNAAERLIRQNGSGAPVAVAYIDLNGFKAINDRYGHSVGDRVLVEVARRLAAAQRDGELIARLGGDEFAVLFEDARSPGAVRRRLQALTSCVESSSGDLAPDVVLGAAAGLAFHPRDGKTIEALLAVADRNMYADKQAGTAGGGPAQATDGTSSS